MASKAARVAPAAHTLAEALRVAPAYCLRRVGRAASGRTSQLPGAGSPPPRLAASQLRDDWAPRSARAGAERLLPAAGGGEGGQGLVEARLVLRAHQPGAAARGVRQRHQVEEVGAALDGEDSAHPVAEGGRRRQEAGDRQLADGDDGGGPDEAQLALEPG